MLRMGLSHRPKLTYAVLLNGFHLTLIMASITKPQDVRKIKHTEMAYGSTDTRRYVHADMCSHVTGTKGREEKELMEVNVFYVNKLLHIHFQTLV